MVGVILLSFAARLLLGLTKVADCSVDFALRNAEAVALLRRTARPNQLLVVDTISSKIGRPPRWLERVSVRGVSSFRLLSHASTAFALPTRSSKRAFLRSTRNGPSGLPHAM